MNAVEFEIEKVKELYGKALKKIAILNVEIENLRKENEILKKQKTVSVGRKAFNNYSTIKLMLDMYLNDYSFNDIAIFLNNNNIKTKAGRSWGKSSVSFVIKSNIELLDMEEREIFKLKLSKRNKNNIEHYR